MPHESRACAHAHGFGPGEFTLPGAEPSYPPDLELEPRHLDIAIALDIPARAATATVKVDVAANRAGARRLVLQAKSFEDLEVSVADGTVPVRWRYDGREIVLSWSQPFTSGESRQVRIAYRVERPIAGLGFSAPDDHYPDRPLWAATDHETERARYWLPCVDHPAVRTTLAFHLTADARLTALANGLPEGEDDNGDGTKTTHWRLDYPCPSYLICFAVGDFVRADDRPVGDREIAYFGARGRATEADLARSFRHTPDIMEWLETKLGNPFPFPKYYQFTLPDVGGAMENISLVSWDDRFVLDPVLEPELGPLTELVNVHEMAHSYFGDAVVMRDFAHAWLKESWATYMEVCWQEDRHGEDEGRYELFRCARGYMAEADGRYQRPIVTRVYDSSWSLFDAHLYPGGAWRLHMLRKKLGDDIFWAAVKDYVATHSKGLVETSDFQRKLEAHSGRSLERFFEQWIYGVGYPQLEVEVDFDDEAETLTFRVKQKQVEDQAAPSDATPAQLFHLDLTIAWLDADGAWQRRLCEVRERSHAFVFAAADEPRQVRVDPDGAVLHRLELNPGDGSLRRQLTDGPDVVARILAAEELAKTGTAENLEAIGAAYGNEAFWGVREGIAMTVAKHRSGLAPGLLAGFLETETDPRVVRTICLKVADLRDPRIAAALAARLAAGLPYRARAAALHSLGAQRDGSSETMATLREAAADTGYRGIVRSGGLRGLGETRQAEALELLQSRLGYGAEIDDSAAAALAAAADCAAFLERPLRVATRERLTEQASDPREPVRSALASALETLGDPAGAAVIDGMLASFAEQDKPRYRRIAKRLRAAPEEQAPVAAVTKRLEELEERHRKLEERFLELDSKVAMRRRDDEG